MRMQIADLTSQGNQLVKRLERYKMSKVEERALEGFYLSRALAVKLIERGVLTSDELSDASLGLQDAVLGFTDKAVDQALAMGDMALIKFSLWHEGQLVDDQTAAPLAYEMGSSALSCESQMLGMKPGEHRVFDIVFGEGFTFKDFVGKVLQIKVELTGIKVRSAGEAVAPS